MSEGRLLQGRVGFIRIEVLKHQTDKKEDIIIFIDYSEVYSEGYRIQQSIADIAHRRPPPRNYILLNDTYQDDSEYYIPPPGGKAAYALKGQKEFAGEIRLKEALISTRDIICSDTDSTLGT